MQPKRKITPEEAATRIEQQMATATPEQARGSGVNGYREHEATITIAVVTNGPDRSDLVEPDQPIRLDLYATLDGTWPVALNKERMLAEVGAAVKRHIVDALDLYAVDERHETNYGPAQA